MGTILEGRDLFIGGGLRDLVILGGAGILLRNGEDETEAEKRHTLSRLG